MNEKWPFFVFMSWIEQGYEVIILLFFFFFFKFCFVLAEDAETCRAEVLGDRILDSFSLGLIDSMLKLSGVITLFAAFEQCDGKRTHVFLGANCQCPLHAFFL